MDGKGQDIPAALEAQFAGAACMTEAVSSEGHSWKIRFDIHHELVTVLPGEASDLLSEYIDGNWRSPAYCLTEKLLRIQALRYRKDKDTFEF
ncbi:hypothetical protein PSHT_08269 [Puccinia striiformis]|uniref:Uncharacterized protein n=1 Tax=Puccinia striiformis TaxID=27350 RepID=A0A2S4VQV8_9BASI|nr:hypothetical protein PSHT_08269 [Puccinia striiformis]